MRRTGSQEILTPLEGLGEAITAHRRPANQTGGSGRYVSIHLLEPTEQEPEQDCLIDFLSAKLRQVNVAMPENSDLTESVAIVASA